MTIVTRPLISWFTPFSGIYALPPEVWRQVFSLLEPADQKSATLVCQRFNETAAPLLWSDPAVSFFNRISARKLVRLRSLHLIRQLRTSGVHMEFEWSTRSGLGKRKEKRKCFAGELLAVIESLENFDGLIVDGSYGNSISLDALRVLGPYIRVMHAEALKLSSITAGKYTFDQPRVEEWAQILRPHAHTIRAINIDVCDPLLCNALLGEFAGLPVTHVRLNNYNKSGVVSESSLRDIQAIRSLATVEEVDALDFLFDLPTLREMARLPIRSLHLNQFLKVSAGMQRVASKMPLQVPQSKPGLELHNACVGRTGKDQSYTGNGKQELEGKSNML